MYAQNTAPPQFRLGDTVKPVRYALDLTIVPTADTFSGRVDIEVEVCQPTSVIRMHGVDLTVKQATLDMGGQTLTARAVTGPNETLGFQFDRAVPAGKAVLHVAYDGRINGKNSAGVFKNKDGADWYAFTQFEATDARRAFPCFDEPSFKTPWQVTLHVQQGESAFANTPVVSETSEPNRMRAVRFAETKPLPSYLVAFAVGPFETVNAGRAGKNNVPLRIITPRGRAAEAAYAASVTGRIVELLEDYTSIPYPFEKLDSISVPLFFGAMENPGLVTYGQPIILAKPSEETISFKRDYAEIAAHELAHMWFGDLVTTQWWNDIWLNEAFATWMEPKIVGALRPEWHAEVTRAQETVSVMGQDGLVSARKIRQPIESQNDIANAFDGITYNKGAAVIQMFENWVGPEKFQKGVQQYLRRHAYGNATAADFLAAIGAATGRDVAPAFSTFLDQAGVPLVSARLKCGQGARPALELSQKRFLPLGSRGSAQQTWQIPVCFKYDDGANAKQQCAVLDRPQAEVALAGANSCPSWVVLNARESGYYRTLYEGGLLDGVLADGGRHLSVPERVGLLSDIQAAVSSGDLPAGTALRLVPEFAGDPNRQVVSSTVNITRSINEHLVPDDLRPNYRRFIEKTYSVKARELGWQPKPGEDDDTGLLRPVLLDLAANVGEDATLIAQADKLARQWLDDHSAVSSDMAGLVLKTAARNGNRSLYDRLLAELNKTKDEDTRGDLLAAISSFRDPAIVKANFEMLVSGRLDPRESFGLLMGPMKDPGTRAMPFEFVRRNYDQVIASLPQSVGVDAGAYMPMIATGFCDEQHRTEAAEFFNGRAAKAVGGPRMLDQALEQISLCIARQKAQEPDVAAFLRNY